MTTVYKGEIMTLSCSCTKRRKYCLCIYGSIAAFWLLNDHIIKKYILQCMYKNKKKTFEKAFSFDRNSMLIFYFNIQKAACQL